MTLVYGSVCSGIEAASVAWRPLGWRPAFFAEIEAFPRAVLAERWPGVPIHGDFTTIEAGQYEPIDVLVGGTPCQSFSVAGKRLGLDDPRGNLAIEFLRLAQRLRPRWLVWENVPGVLSSNEGRDFGAFLGLMGDSGYGFAYRVLDGQFAGVPQRRRRVFVVGYLGDWRPAAAVLFEPESLSGHPPPSREAGQGVARPLAGSSPGGSGYRCDADTADNLVAASIAPAITGNPYGDHESREGLLVAFGGNNTSGPIETATACRAKGGSGHGDFESETFIAHALRADGFDASEDGTGRGTPLVPVSVRTANTGANGHGVAVGVAHTLDGANGQAIAFTCKDHGADAGEVAPTLRSMSESDGNANAGGQVAIAFNARTRWAVRRLTPRECERLMAMPDDYTLVRYRNKPAADGPRYKAIGNSMIALEMRWIGERIALCHALLDKAAA